HAHHRQAAGADQFLQPHVYEVQGRRLRGRAASRRRAVTRRYVFPSRHASGDLGSGFMRASRYTLKQRLGSGGMGEVWLALADGRAANIVHRDLSPDNLLISCDAEVKVSDFGIAKATVAWRAETQLGFKGKWGYVSPESLMGEEVDRRADVYAMGVVLYEMLS